MKSHTYGVILAGGSGTRFWPLSRERFPKQLLQIIGEGTLLEQTFERLIHALPPHHITLVTNEIQAEAIKLQLVQWKEELEGNVLVEPEGRNTAPAIALAALQLLSRDPEAIMVVVPADHVVQSPRKFTQAVKFAVELAQKEYLVTFGVRPTRPETGYGYIQPRKRTRVGSKGKLDGYRVERFVEKPDLPTAKRYVRSGNYFWNAGIFVWKASTILRELTAHQSRFQKSLNDLGRKMGTEAFAPHLRKVYPKLPSLSIDHAVMEHSEKSVVVPVDFGWSDVGSWGSLEEVAPQDKSGNVKNGNIFDMGSEQSVLFADRRVVATIGLKDMVVVDTPDATLICPKDRAQDVKGMVNILKEHGAPEHLEHRTIRRPWGSYTVLEEGKGYKVKRIEVEPGKRLSLQWHRQRSEHWVVIAGIAQVTCGDKEYQLRAGESTGIPREVPHRLGNPGDTVLEIIEIQNGAYLGEDDIVRIQDDFQRSTPSG